MSDFDAEAERKRLREKYEAEEESRKQTQQMSELLLKGATMTNQHCGECGSPIFRYEDQEFCPNCQQTMGDGADGGTDAAKAAEATDSNPTDVSETDRSEPAETGIDTGTDAETARTGGVAPSNGVAADAAAGHGRDAGRGVADDSPAEKRSDASPEPTTGDDGTAPTHRGARESLLAALTRHARLAADTDEPRRATDHLEAARTAAAALDELDGS